MTEATLAAAAQGSGRAPGAAGRRRCDAALVPTLPCANLDPPAIMTAARIADPMRGGD